MEDLASMAIRFHLGNDEITTCQGPFFVAALGTTGPRGFL
jgi:hypothetical protein